MEQAQTLDRIAKHYGKLPSEIRSLSLDDFLFDLHIYSMRRVDDG